MYPAEHAPDRFRREGGFGIRLNCKPLENGSLFLVVQSRVEFCALSSGSQFYIRVFWNESANMRFVVEPSGQRATGCRLPRNLVENAMGSRNLKKTLFLFRNDILPNIWSDILPG